MMVEAVVMLVEVVVNKMISHLMTRERRSTRELPLDFIYRM